MAHNFTVFYGLLYRYGRRMIARKQFISGWRAEQERQGIERRRRMNDNGPDGGSDYCA
jgi:hypothetical protein